MARCKNVSGPTASSGGSPGGDGGGDPPIAYQPQRKAKARSWLPRKGRPVIERPRSPRQWQQQLRKQRGVVALVH